MSEALENVDYVLIADVLEYEILPKVEKNGIKNYLLLQGKSHDSLRKEHAFTQAKDLLLYNKMNLYQSDKEKYIPVMTTSGDMTLKVISYDYTRQKQIDFSAQ